MTDSRKQPPLAFPEGGIDARLQALEARPEVAELRQSLQALPDVEPDPSVWAGIQNRVQRPAAASADETSGRGSFSLRPFALAAGLLLAVSAGMLSVNVIRDADLDQTLPPNQVASLPLENQAIQSLRDRSRQLDPMTQSDVSDPVMSAFRYRIADVDSQLASIPEGRLNQEEAQRLWGQRVALLESLAEVRRGRAALQPAVY